ncbi:MAG: lyase [Nitrosarchaeum sp.]|nr:MAG: lyase [Nitrosarchaeum sp.]
MKKKGIILAAFFATIMLSSLGASVFLKNTPTQSEDVLKTSTGTPADNFPDAQRAQFCGSGDAKSTTFVKEYTIPTACTNPLAIVTDYNGNAWFAQTNTGKLAKFDPNTESFTEFDNPIWPKNGRSMMWGIDYSPDGSLWFTDESYDSVWKFSTQDEKYQRIGYPSEGNSLPQKLKVDGSQIIINDFTGNKITFLDPTQSNDNLRYLSLPSPVNGSVTGDFAIDTDNNVWYTNWVFQQGGILIKFDQEGYRNSVANVDGDSFSILDYTELFQLPSELLTPNGIAVSDGMIWLADTSSSAVFNFDPVTQQFTQYVTSNPKISTYGNSTGIIKSPISRPYWIETNSAEQLVFNEQTANSIAILDPKSESLVEYMIPSKNPFWGDCDNISDCGLAQVFDFAINDDKIWFTEWVENNIGVVDTSIALPFEIELDSKDISLAPGESRNFSFTISPQQDLSDVSLILSDPYNFLDVASNVSDSFQLDAPRPVEVTISASDDAIPGKYKILLGAQIKDVSISKFVTVTILP